MRRGQRATGVILVAGLVATAACAAALRHPTPEDAARLLPAWPGTTVEDLQRGRSLYVRRCSGCHNLILPRAFPPAKWPGKVDDMADKARLGPAERDDVVRFLVAVATDDRNRAAR